MHCSLASRLTIGLLHLFPFFACASTQNWSTGFHLGGTNNLITCMDATQDEVYIAGLFSRINGNRPCYRLARYDGRRWTPYTDSINAPNYPNRIKVRNNVIWIAANEGMYTYDNGWTLVGNTGGLPVSDFDFDASGNLYVCGNFSSINGVSANGLARFDGTNWTALGSGVNLAAGSVVTAIQCVNGNGFASGNFNKIGGVSTSGLARWNGSTWSATPTSGLILGLSSNFCAFNGELYLATVASATGFNGTTRVFKLTPNGLQQLGGVFSSDVRSLRIVNNTLTAAGYFTEIAGTPVNNLAAWDGSTWINAGEGLNFVITDIASNGQFTLAGGDGSLPTDPVDYRHVALKTTNTWKPAGLGMGNWVECLRTQGSNTYAAGYFTDAGGVRSQVVKWNGLDWDTLNGGMILGTVRELAVYRDTLYAGGDFSDPTTFAPHYIIRWNGSAWEPVPNGVNYRVWALEVYNDELYVGGDFSATGTGAANNLAKFDGQNWLPIGSGTNGIVKDIKFDQNGVMYVGGGFTQAGGIQARRIARYDGNTWSELGSGVDQFVEGIGISPSNEVYIVGSFTLGPNVGLLNHIAKYNGTTLQPVGGGIGSFSDVIYDLQFVCGKMYVTGIFRLNGADTLNHIAVYDGTQWLSLDQGLRQDGTLQTYGISLAAQNNRLWVGGSFGFAGSERANHISAYYPEGTPSMKVENVYSSACTGDTLTYRFKGENLGANAQVRWFLNNSFAGIADSIISVVPVNDGDVLYAQVITDPVCGVPDTLRTEPVIIRLTQLSAPAVSQTGSVFTVINPDPLSEQTWQGWNGSTWSGLVPAAIGNSFTASGPGQYRVKSAKGTCIRFSSPSTITALGEFTESSGRPVCTPNPASGVVSILNTDGFSQLEVLDGAGRCLHEERIHASTAITLDLSGLSQGVYFISFRGESRATDTIRLLIE
ncbi:MAG: T9SS type A sorting domain-containing protein [Bacteroidota bacterium]